MQQIRTKLTQKQKAFYEFFLAFSKWALNLKVFQKKMTLIADFFPKLRTPEKWLDICPKSPVSKVPLTGKMVNAFKHCCDLDNSTVTIFTDHLEGN